MTLGLYVHIPFCVRKCLYCDFLSFSADDPQLGGYAQDVREAYTKRLLSEIDKSAPLYSEYEITSVFFGGGTPSYIEETMIARILTKIRESFRVSPDCEISLECNPGTLSPDKLNCFHDAGINRLSIGLQSASDKELRTLGRIHDFSAFLDNYATIIKTGFNNINIDLMYGIPDQTLESYRKTLETVMGLSPAPVHISAYSLIVEEGTPFYKMDLPLPSEDEEREMDKITEDILLKHGLKRYEISNYAKSGRECRHNIRYWKRQPYLGLGLGASSMVDEIRWKNTPDLKKYLSGMNRKEDYQVLSSKEQMEEFIFLGLRMSEGIRLRDFEEYFSVPFPKAYWDLVYRFENVRLMDVFEDRDGIGIRLTKKGRDVSNTIFSEFLL